MADGMLRLRRLAADRLLISHSVLSLPSRLFVALLLVLRPLVRLFKSIQFLLRCGFLRRKGEATVMETSQPVVELHTLWPKTKHDRTVIWAQQQQTFQSNWQRFSTILTQAKSMYNLRSLLICLIPFLIHLFKKTTEKCEKLFLRAQKYSHKYITQD